MSEIQVKCPGCHAYFVDEGELCANCAEKKRKTPDQDESQNE